MSVLVNTDSYKLSHKGFMDEGTEVIYSNFTARSDKHLPILKDVYDHKAVFFGLQYFVKDYLINEWNDTFFSLPKEKVISKFKRVIDAYLGPDAVSMEHFEMLHDLGYLPIEIKALPEGSRVNIKVPMLTIKNTDKRFAWLTNYLETVMSCELWKPITTATIIAEYRKLVNQYALKTTGSVEGTMFQLHGFEFRGMSGRKDAAINGAAFVLSSCGTDTIPALPLLEEFYNADVTKEFIAASVPASEHSIACLGTAVKGELESYRKWITVDYPTGIVSLVSDTYDYFKVLYEYMPALKADILARPVNAIGLSKVVIRPDSGNPADIICGTGVVTKYDPSLFTFSHVSKCCQNRSEFLKPVYFEYDGKYYKSETKTFSGSHEEYEQTTEVSVAEIAPIKGSVELLWEVFGGTVTEQGFKVLDSHIGIIYGDSITLEVAQEVFKRLEAKGFASTNVVFGVGSYTMQYLTRDSLGMAVKATYAEVNGVGYELYKDPITDSGMKKSAKGLLRVEEINGDFVLFDQQTKEQEQKGVLETVFKDGKIVKETSLTEIRNRLWG